MRGTAGGRRTMRLPGLLLGLQLLVGSALLCALAVGPAAAASHDSSHSKVVIIVGPVGSLTDSYRALGDGAAQAARAHTDNVVTIYSPDATWPAVRDALDGASIVVYLGHGNGWPSPYRDALYGLTQNGLGLNPVAGVNDRAHQYFGEYYLAQHIKLAPGAVVILGHLCYASGNPEPGGPDPTLSVAQQRADNYAAGWLAAGATAVVAEGHGRPSYYVKAILEGRDTIEEIWRSGPTFNDHVIEAPSARTRGAALMLDPDRKTRGFFRALTVIRGVRAGDSPSPTPAAGPAAQQRLSPAQLGAHLGLPELAARTVVGSDGTLSIAADPATLAILPADVSIGATWIPLVMDAPARPAPADGEAPAGAAATPSGAPAAPAAATAEPDPTPAHPASAAPRVVSPSEGPAASGSSDPNEPPAIDLIVPEATDSLVVVAPAARTRTGLTIPITLPAEPGLYRLVTTLHDPEQVAYDDATQDLVAPILVRVTASLSAAYGVPFEIRAAPGEPLTIRARVANTGTELWAPPTAVDPGTGRRIATNAGGLLVARWVGLDDVAAELPAESNVAVRADLNPGEQAILSLDLVAPTRLGSYLLIFDLQTQDGRSLASLGVPPAITRVVVGPTLPKSPTDDDPRTAAS